MAHVGKKRGLGLRRGLRGRLGPLELALGLLALDEQTHLAPDGFKHPEDVLVRLADLVAEELHHAEETAGPDDGEAERPVQAAADRVRRPREVGVLSGVGNPGRTPALPDTSGQADAGRKYAASVHLGEFLEGLGHRRPHLCAPQHTHLPVQGPARAQHPVEAFPDRAEDSRHGLSGGPRLDEDARGGVLRGEAPLADLPPMVRAIERPRRDSGHGREDQDVRDGQEGQADLGAEETCAMAEKPEAAQHRGDRGGNGENPTGKPTAHVVAYDGRHEAAVRPGAQGGDAERQERDGGGQRHRNVAADAVQLAHGVHIAQE